MALKKKFNYFDAFERQTEFAVQEAKLLIEVIENYPGPDGMHPYIERAHEIEHSGDKVCRGVFAAISTDFITPIEREDILNMTQELDNVLDIMEGIAQRFYMLNTPSMHKDALEFARILLRACEMQAAAMKEFRNFKNSKKLDQLTLEVARAEEAADELFFRVVHELFSGLDQEPVMVYTWDKLFQRFEDAVDACERVADLIGFIVMKNA